MASDAVAYDKRDLRNIVSAFKAMDDASVAQAKAVSNGLAKYLQSKIIAAATATSNSGDDRIAVGSRVGKTSKIGEISFGFVSQKFSGGGTTQQLWGGYEFGSNKYKNFPKWSGRQGRGSKGYFIYPTLRAEQPYIIAQWEAAFSKIVRKW